MFPDLFMHVTSPFLSCRLSSYSSWVSLGSPCVVLSVTPEETPPYSQLDGERGAERGIRSAFFF